MKMKILKMHEPNNGTIMVKNFKWLQTLLGIIKPVFKSQLMVVMSTLTECDRINYHLKFLNKLTTQNMLQLLKKLLTSIIMADQQHQK